MIRHLIFKGVVLSMALLTFGSVASGTEDPIRKHSSHYKAFLLADAQTGRILDTDRPQRLIYPASLVKMMVALIVLEEVDSGKRRLREKVLVSRSASKIGGSQVYLREGEVFELLELMKAMVISSANDAAVAVAEHVSGSRAKFMKRMNRRAWELGMQRTRFHSPHGLPVRRGQQPDVTTAYDLYLLSLELLKHPQYLKWSSTRLDTFRNGTFQLTNTNHRLIRNYPGMDGMKTGFYSKAGFNLVATAKRKKMRLLSIVIGTPNHRWRSFLTTSLLDKGFKEYMAVQLNPTGITVRPTVQVLNGEVERLKLQTAARAVVMLNAQEQQQVTMQVRIPALVEAPVVAGSRLGTLEYMLGGKVFYRVPLQASHDVGPRSLLATLTHSLGFSLD